MGSVQNSKGSDYKAGDSSPWWLCVQNVLHSLGASCGSAALR